MIYIFVALIVVLVLYWYFELRDTKQPALSINKPVITVTPPSSSAEHMESSWIDKIANNSLENGIIESHREYTANTSQYSSGANFTSVADDNTNSAFTNFTGFARPYYIPLNPNDKTIPSHDVEVLKRNKHMTFR